MVDYSELAAALLQAGEPKPPTQSDPFDYPLTEAIRRAKGGSTADARLLLLLASAMLIRPLPAAIGCAMLPSDLAAYVGEALHKAARGTDAKRALRLVRNKGRSAKDNAERDEWIAYIAAWFKHCGSRKHLSDTANLLTESGYPPPGRAGAWTSQAISAAIRSHELKNK
jgi:hypothetical protein